MKIAIGAGAVVTIGVAGLIWWEYEKIKTAFSTQQGAQALANSSPALASLAISLGFKTPAGWVPDVTGAAGQQATQQAFDAVVNPTSQGFYNASLLEYARDNGFETSLSAQGTGGWPWTSYDAWVSAGVPGPLPGSNFVTVDSNGVYHNRYV